jgi:hypothetical protein
MTIDLGLPRFSSYHPAEVLAEMYRQHLVEPSDRDGLVRAVLICVNRGTREFMDEAMASHRAARYEAETGNVF